MTNSYLANGFVLAPLWTFYKLLLEDFVHNFGQNSYKVGFASHYYLISKEGNVLSVNQNSIEEMYRQNCVFCLKRVYLGVHFLTPNSQLRNRIVSRRVTQGK